MVMRVYLQAKRIFFLCLALFILTSGPLFAQKKTNVLLKFSKHEGLMRIVFEAEEPFITKTKATTSPSEIKVEFPGPFNITAQKDLPFEVTPMDKSLVITLKEIGEIKLLRLSSPSRIVFDIQKGEKQYAPILSKVFVFDAGHGGYDFGITSGDTKEKDISLELAKNFDAALLKKGKKVFLTRKVDQYLSIIDRIKFANQKSPDVFISLHSSMSEDFALYVAKFKDESSDEMVDLYSLSSSQKKFIKKSRALSDSIGKAIKDEFQKDVIYREMPLPLLNSIGAPAILIEFPSPKFITYDQQMKVRLVDAILNGIAAYGQ
jgi:N-acetylmuramoyl-L-alanine amidase